MVPAPRTAARLIGRGWASPAAPGSLAAARSAKKRWIKALRAGLFRQSKKAARSKARPSAKLLVQAASTQSTIFHGATKPFHFDEFLRRTSSKSCASTPSVLAVSWLARGSSPPASALARAKATAPARRSPSTTASTSPRPCARAAPMGLPERITSSAVSGPVIRGSRWVPPAPGRRPRFTSGSPSLASGDATRKWQPSATSSPPPSALPEMAATRGFGDASSRSQRSGSGTPRGGLAELLDVGPGDEDARADHHPRPARQGRPPAARGRRRPRRAPRGPAR